MYLVDTSIWIDLLSKRPSFQLKNEQLIQLCVCPPVIQELLQGFPPDHRYEPMKEAILSLPCLAPNMSLDLYIQAGEIYRSGRRRGFTIRSSIDCLIAAIAMAHNVSVWHKDRDFDAIAGFTELIVVSELSAK